MTNRNIFLPISRGGMGVLPVDDFRFALTKPQRRLAARLCDATNHPLPGYPYIEPDLLAVESQRKSDSSDIEDGTPIIKVEPYSLQNKRKCEIFLEAYFTKSSKIIEERDIAPYSSKSRNEDPYSFPGSGCVFETVRNCRE